MSDTISISMNKDADKLTVTLQGQIDEDADYSPINAEGMASVVFDMEGITLINSTGLQKWISFLESMPDQITVRFERCPPRIVNQINLFPGFLAGRDIDIASFFAPYFCESCDESHNVLLETKVQFPDSSKPKAPGATCPKCNKEMDFDGIEKKYFMFIQR